MHLCALQFRSFMKFLHNIVKCLSKQKRNCSQFSICNYGYLNPFRFMEAGYIVYFKLNRPLKNVISQVMIVHCQEYMSRAHRERYSVQYSSIIIY